MFNYNFKKYLIILLIFLVIITATIAVFFKEKKAPQQEEKKLSVPTITPVIIKPKRIFPSPQEDQFIPSNVIPTFTGVKEEEIPEEEKIKLEEDLNLRRKIPISTENFDINYDYHADKFVVILKEPFAENRDRFNQWLIDNHFDKIPAEAFDFR